MTALLRPYQAEDEPAAVPLAARAFTAFRVTSGGRDLPFQPKGFGTCEGRPIAARDADEALNAALSAITLAHKDRLVIRETGHHVTPGRHGEPIDWLHVYLIRQKSAPRYVWKDHRQVAERDLYAEHVCTFDARAAA